MKLSEFFERAQTKDIVINTDLDGFLSGMLLQKYYECRVVGFSNSNNKIWIDKEWNDYWKNNTPVYIEASAPVYIDIFINNKRVCSIDQHIIAAKKDQLDRIARWGTKLNPNLDITPTTFEEFSNKYPFGTVHYLIAKMKEDGYDNVFEDLDSMHGYSKENGTSVPFVTRGQLILRADDALLNTHKYIPNAENWWKRLLSSRSQTIKELYEHAEKYKDKGEDINKKIERLFRNKRLRCSGADGAYEEILDKNNCLSQNVIQYNNDLSVFVGLEPLVLPKKYSVYEAKSDTCKYNPNDNYENIAMTYAFIFGPNSTKNNFSYSIGFKGESDNGEHDS